MKLKLAISALASTLLLSACVTTQGPTAGYGQPQYQYGQQQQPQYQQGQYSAQHAEVINATVEGVRQVQVQQGASDGGNNAMIGAVAGAVIGGVLGNQVGRGTGKTLATVGGAAAGGYAGHVLGSNYGGQQQTAPVTALEISVYTNDGRRFVVMESTDVYVRQGQRIQLRRQPDGSFRVVR